MSVEDLLKLIGLGAPFAYAAGTFKFFSWADRKVSKEAKGVISNWIKSTGFDRDYIAWAVQQVFDRVYGYPFLSLRTVGRVAALSIIVNVVLIFELESDLVGLGQKYPVVGVMWALQMIVNIACDYVSIFAIRAWLGIAGRRPVFALFGGLLVGIIVIRILYVFLGFAYMTDFGANIRTHGRDELNNILQYRMPAFSIACAAFAIHLWLPIFALSLLLAKALSWIARATQWTQWFIEGGKEHPIQSVGYVASGIVFGCSIIFNWLRYHVL